jgi:hypothetical protein
MVSLDFQTKTQVGAQLELTAGGFCVANRMGGWADDERARG